MDVRKRIASLRALMNERDIAAWVVASADPHQSEYPPEHWRARAWLTGFDGSAGTLIVTATRAGLWTDFRYFLAAERSLAGSGIELFRLGEPDVLDYPDWLARTLDEGDRVGFDALCFSVAAARTLESRLAPRGITVVPEDDLVGMVWEGRPPLPRRPISAHDVRYAGQSRGEKLSSLRAKMAEAGVEWHLVSTLDDIAWLLNIRGSDVPYNPVAVAYLLVGPERATLFVHEGQLPPELQSELESDGVDVAPYGSVVEAAQGIPEGAGVVVSPQQTSVALQGALAGRRCVERRNLSTDMKAQKHAVELDHLRELMIRDGAAMVRFIHWVTTRVGEEEITELSAEVKLRSLRAEDDRFVSESFRSISGYRGHGAIVHYSADETSSSRLEPAGIYLIDSGGQYLDGTTDITRTIALGEPSEQARRDFTLVLKGHIGLATLRFPLGTTGHMIDVVAREHLWREGMNYGHGTGHGVGFFLNVHEGPQRISQSPNDVALRPGMVVSNEPGLYRAEQYGIRIENLVAVTEPALTEFGSFLAFETLTLCPIDRRLIEVSLLTAAERSWVDDYHRRVRDSLLGRLPGPVGVWLEAACAPL